MTLILMFCQAAYIAVGKLNAAISLLEPRFRRLTIKINIRMNNYTLSKRLRDDRRSMRPEKIFNENIPWTNETKYLGVAFDSKLTYNTHTSYIL
jgi:hypothetical protein